MSIFDTRYHLCHNNLIAIHIIQASNKHSHYKQHLSSLISRDITFIPSCPEVPGIIVGKIIGAPNVYSIYNLSLHSTRCAYHFPQR